MIRTKQHAFNSRTYAEAMDLVRSVGIVEFVRPKGDGWEQLIRIFRYLDNRCVDELRTESVKERTDEAD